jgi:hypothetical protein
MIRETIELYDGPTLLARVTDQDKFPENILPKATYMVIRTEMTREDFDKTYSLRGAGRLIQKYPEVPRGEIASSCPPHVSDGLVYTSMPPKSKCIKCGQFY